MKKDILIIPAIIFVLFSGCTGTNFTNLAISETDLDNFGRIIEEIEKISPRKAGTAEEIKTSEYILSTLKQKGIKGTKEPFSYSTFAIDSVTLDIDGNNYEPVFMGIDPFEGRLSFNEEAYVLNPGKDSEINPEGMVFISGNKDLFFMALQMGAKAFFSIDEDKFAGLANKQKVWVKAEISGEKLQTESANIVADIGTNPEGSKTLYISAHYDSYLDSPGANDNGTGVSGALILAGLLKEAEKSLPYNIRFVFPGAEEKGLVGSRQYIGSHMDDLDDCICLINMDTFGGNDAPFIASVPDNNADGQKGLNDPVPTLLKGRSLEGPEGKWRMFDTSIFSIVTITNYPEWLRVIVDESADNSDLEVKNLPLMSDHSIFAAAGVPAISVQSRDHVIHSPADIAKNINYVSCEKCLNLSLGIIKGVLSSYSEN